MQPPTGVEALGHWTVSPGPHTHAPSVLTSCCCFSSSRLTVLQPMFSSPSDSEPPLAERSSSLSKSWDQKLGSGS